MKETYTISRYANVWHSNEAGKKENFSWRLR